LGVAPWELLEQPFVWTEWALMAQNAEAGANQREETTSQANQ